MRQRGGALALLLAAALCPMGAQAACHRQENAAAKVWRPSVKDEFAASKYVVEGVALREEPVFLRADHRLLLTRYTVQVLRAHKGKPGPTIVLTSKNSAAQFPMALGVKYLLFVQKELIAGARHQTHVHWYVYDCGNSDTLEAKNDALREVQALSAQHAHPKHARQRQQPRASAAPHA